MIDMNDVPMTTWWWIRHAPVTSNEGRIYGAGDPPCDTSNQPVFQWLARRLPEDALWVTSHLQRTKQTAAAVWQEMTNPPAGASLEESRLGEQSFGEWQGRPYAELDAIRDEAWHRFWLAPARHCPPGGESFVDLMARVSAAVEEISDRHAGRHIVAVAHGGTIRAALGQALALDPESALSFAIENCSLTRIDHFAASPGAHSPDHTSSWRVAWVNGNPTS